jgi:NET1-associated nuclear protein 1 (U3 small nucleolar RNA-associated protein 17)
MADATSQLKRKRESAGAPLKNLKKQRKSEAGASAGADAKDTLTLATPVAQSTLVLPKTEKTPDISRTNGAHEDAPASTLSGSKHIKNEPIDKQNGVTDYSDVEDGLANSAHKNSRRQQKKDRKHKKKIKDLDIDGDDEQIVAVKVKGLTKKRKQKDKIPPTWSKSSLQGGWFLPSDPIFSADEKFLILANLKSLQIYSIETSVLVTTLPLGASGVLTAYALSPTAPNHVYLASSKGVITLWNWVDGTKVGSWDTTTTIRNMIVITLLGAEEDLVYCHEAGESYNLNVHALPTRSEASEIASKHVLTSQSAIRSFQVLSQGKYVIVITADSVMLGKRLKPSKTALQDFEYVWRELKFSKRITTCDAYIRQVEVIDKSKRSATAQRDVIDLAVGDETGVILLFEDMLASFAAIENFKKSGDGQTDDAESLRPKRLHWHRDAVGSVKWSLDGMKSCSET